MPDNDAILRISRRYLSRARLSRDRRKRKNAENWQAYAGDQDFTHKAEFQSRETTPGFPLAIEHIVGTFERALTDNDDWVSADAPGIGEPLMSPSMIRGVLLHYLQRLWVPGNRPETTYGVQVFVGDAIKRGLIEGLVVGKIYPVLVKRKQYRYRKPKRSALDPGSYPAHELAGKTMEPIDVEVVRLAVDLVAWEDYYRDPSPALRYEIHRTRRQLHELRSNPEYDQEAVDRMYSKATADVQEFERRQRTGENYVAPDPYEIEVFEGWGDVIDETTGELLHENVFWAWGGDEVLRDPTPNPTWDGTRPFIVAPLIRVPGSTVHKALADHAVPMWRAANELVNLLLDAAMRGAWGVGQVRPDIMESPEEIADGIPQGYTAVLKPNVPQGHKFYERVDNGETSNVSLDGLNRIEAYINEALATPDTKLGQLPPRQVKATEIVSAMQASGSLFESMAARFEDTFLEPLFEKAWKLIVQYADDFVVEELVQVLGPRLTLQLAGMSPEERWQFISHAKFKVRGLRGVATKERTFSKLMNVANLLSTSPQLLDAFGRTKDFQKLFDQILSSSGVDPESLELTEEPVPAQPGTVAAGQIQPGLAAATGASAPGEGMAEAQAAQGGEAEFAPTAPQAQGA
ncbi:MAG: portal protein [Egibacteraceae bacterium]